MTCHELPRLDPWSDDADAPPSIDALIRPGLHRAFPLPAEDHAGDDRFRVLLEALAHRHHLLARQAPPLAARD